MAYGDINDTMFILLILLNKAQNIRSAIRFYGLVKLLVFLNVVNGALHLCNNKFL